MCASNFVHESLLKACQKEKSNKGHLSNMKQDKAVSLLNRLKFYKYNLIRQLLSKCSLRNKFTKITLQASKEREIVSLVITNFIIIDI